MKKRRKTPLSAADARIQNGIMAKNIQNNVMNDGNKNVSILSIENCWFDCYKFESI